MSASFGFFTDQTSLTWSGGHIEPLPDQDVVVQGVLGDERHYAGWLYPPLRKVLQVSGESRSRPAVPVTFGLSPTHFLTLSDADANSETEDFFIALFGLLKGLRLQRAGWQHFYRCPTKRGTLCDFYADDKEVVQTLELATAFWQRYPDASIRKLAFGAIHWHLFAQLYEHEFERFNAQYTAFDACWALAKQTLGLTRVGHAERPAVLAGKLGLIAPGWALPVSQGQNACSLSVRRNALVHEAMYAGEPVGFAHPQTERGMELELTNFVARAIFALLGVRNEYTRSPVDTRQCFGFSQIK